MSEVNQTSLPPSSSLLSVRPTLSTFVDLARHAAFEYTLSRLLPQEFRESQSVASSIAIGRGACYVITRKDVPPIRDDLPLAVPQQSLRDSIGGQSKPNISAPTTVVYKTARVSFNSIGEAKPSSEATYASVLLDFLILSHKPTTQHRNLITLLGLAWGNTQDERPSKIPIPIVQFAQFGSLAELQASHILSVSHKSRLLMDVATGLRFLHQCDIVHGDVKCENILVFADTNHKYCAKVSDFGTSMPGGQGVFDFVIRGTSMWAAPEMLARTYKRSSLAQSDAFSFGLTAWRVAMDGEDPLSRYILSQDDISNETSPDFLNTTRPPEPVLCKVFQDEKLLERAVSAVWRPKLLRLKTTQKMNRQGSDGLQSNLAELEEGVDNLIVADSAAASDAFYLCLDKILRKTLSFSPDDRDLASAKEDLDILNGRDPGLVGPEVMSITTTRQYKNLMQNGFVMSYIAMREIQPEISHFIFSHILTRAKAARETGYQLAHIEMSIAACQMSGMGSDRFFNAAESLSACLRATNSGSSGARAILYRFAKLLGKTAHIGPWLEWSACRGSLAALEDLEEWDPNHVQRAKANLRNCFCGIGANFFNKLIGPFTYPQFSDMDAIGRYLDEGVHRAEDIVVNSRGDTLIHAAASVGSLAVVRTLLEKYHVPVDTRNPQGETPLLCAMRAGHVELVDVLLDHSADAGVQSERNESIPHWLISIPDSAVEMLLERLIANGSNIKKSIWAQSCDYAATDISTYHDRWDKPGAGTPLHWAVSRKRIVLVKALLSHGANHDDRGNHAVTTTPFEQAAYFHDYEILRIIIDTKFQKPRWPRFDTGHRQNSHTKSDEVPAGSFIVGLSNVIREAINGSDRFLMVLRWGSRYREQLRESFRLLGEELAYQELTDGVDLQGRSPLQFAANRGFHEAAEFVYEFMDGPTWINVPYNRGGGITPIFDAVRRDNKTLFNFLLERRADLSVRIDSPGLRDRLDWCILHTAAENIQGDDYEMAIKLLDHGIPPDGYLQDENHNRTETPLAIAIENNKFGFANLLREKGGNINSLSCYTLSSRVKVKYPTTILGRVIIGNLRDCVPRLRYLLWSSEETEHFKEPDFLVSPIGGLTALHAAVLTHLLRDSSDELDRATRLRILKVLLEKYGDDAEQLNAPTSYGNQVTALHLAVWVHDVDMVHLLLESEDIDLHRKNKVGDTPFTDAMAAVARCERQGKLLELEKAKEILANFEERAALEESG